MNSDMKTEGCSETAAHIRNVQRTNWSEYDDVGTAIAETVATVTGRAHTDLEPLQYSVDVGALHTLCTTAKTEHLEITFTYEGVDVRVTNDGVVEVEQ